MKFNGKFIVTKSISARDLILKQNAVYKNTTIQGSLTVAGPTNFQDNAVINTFSGKDDNALANQKYIKEQTTDVILRETGELKPADGKNGDIAFEGRIKETPGDYNIVDFQINKPLVNDGTGVYYATLYKAEKTPPYTFITTTDMINTKKVTFTGLPTFYRDLYICPTGKPGHLIVWPDVLYPGMPERHPWYTTDNGKTWTAATTHTMNNRSPRSFSSDGNTTALATDFRANVTRDGGETYYESGYDATKSGATEHLKAIKNIKVRGRYIAIINDKHGVYISQNYGSSFNRVVYDGSSVYDAVPMEFYTNTSLIVGKTASQVTTVNCWGRNQTEHRIQSVPSNSEIKYLGVQETTKTIVALVWISGSNPNMKVFKCTYGDGETPTLTPWVEVPTDFAGIDIRMTTGHIVYNGMDHVGHVTNLPSGKALLTIKGDGSFATIRKPPITPRLMNMYTKHEDKWIKYTPDATTAGDERYASIAGGEIGKLTLTDNIDLAGNKLINVPLPVTDTDIVSKQYVDTIVSGSAGGSIDATIGTSSTTIDTTTSATETLVYSISASHSTGRYYSRVNVIADGTNNPTSAEYSVLAIGNLDITIDVEKDGSGNTLLKAKSNASNTKIRVKREIIDL